MERRDTKLTDNDKLAKKLDRILVKQQSITVNYKRVDQKVEKLADFTEKTAP